MIDIVPEKAREDTVKTVKNLSFYLSTLDDSPEVVIRRIRGAGQEDSRSYRPSRSSRNRANNVVNHLVWAGAWKSSVSVGGRFLMVSAWPIK
jgi:hypothetical protein